MKTMKFILSTLCIFTIFLSTSYAETINVPSDIDSIQGGINLANDGDTVLVSEGTYYENIDFRGKAITLASHFILDNDTSHISKTIIDGNQPANPDSGSVVYFTSGEDTTSILCGFTITGGSGTAYHQYNERVGGGIVVINSGARIQSNLIINNTNNGDSYNVYGGGIGYYSLLASTYLIVENNKINHNAANSSGRFAFGGGVMTWGHCRFTDNEISYNSCISAAMEANGGGIKLGGNSSQKFFIIINNNSITHNFVKGKKTTGHNGAKGGGIVSHLNKVIISGNTISHNELDVFGDSDAYGAGISLTSAANGSIISNNTITKNSIAGIITSAGGGISILDCTLPIKNNIIKENSAQNGGGIGLSGNLTSATVYIINNTVVQNSAINGGGLYKDSKISANILNTIFWGNYAASDSQIAGIADVFYSDIEGGWEGKGNLNFNPYFSDSLLNLSDSSICVGNGTDSLAGIKCPSTDYYGNQRPNSVDDYVDIGAIESSFIRNKIPTTLEYKKLKQLDFQLSQNYPNPFNPSTTIEFSLPKSEFVELKVFNLLGKETSTLVSNKLNQGNHIYTFNGNNLASGIYYYQLKAGEYREVKKMILLK